MDFYFLRFFSFLLWPIIIIGLIVFFVVRRRKKIHPSQDKEWYLQLALSREDAVSQLFLLLAFIFFGVTLLAFNRDFGDPVSWRTILFITSLLGLISAYYFKTIYSLAFSLIGFICWLGAQSAQWIDSKEIKTATILAGLCFLALLFYSLGHLHEREIKFKRFALVYLILGIITITSVLFFLSTKPGIGIIGGMTKGILFFGSWQMTLLLLIIFVCLIGITLYAVSKKLMSSFELAAVFALACLFGITAFLPEQTMFVEESKYYSYYGAKELSDTGILWAIFYNIAIFLEILGLFFSGYIRREAWLINLGAFFLFLLIIVKYFDWFFTFLDKSVFFIGAGILLFIVGWFMERGRRYMISNIKNQTEQTLQ